MPAKSMPKEKVELERKIILDHALTIVGEEGYRNLSMRKIGKSCEFSHAKIYYYFSNKDEILLMLVDRGFDHLRDMVFKQCESKQSEKEKFLICLNALYEFGINEPNYFNLMFGIEVPKYADFISIGVDSSSAFAQKEKAIDFYNFYSQVTKDYTKSINVELTSDEILNIFIQISGIVWFENARLLKEINHSKTTLLETTIDNILKFLEEK